MNNLEEIKQHVDNIFNDYVLHYLSYEGGSGGEFLVTKLRQYAPAYRTENTSTYLNNSNKTILAINHLLTVIYFSRLDNGNLQDIKDLIIKELCRIANNDPAEVIKLIESTRDILTTDYANLCKLHLTKNSYFDQSNTWTLYVDCQNSFNYIKRLRFLKVFNNKWEVDLILDNYKINYWKDAEKIHILDNFTTWIKNKGIKELEEIYVPCIFYENISNDFKSYDQLLSITPTELYKRYSETLDSTYELKKDFYDETSANTNRINISRLFEKNYLEDFFQITDSNFRADLLEWHVKNLRLLNAHGLDHHII